MQRPRLKCESRCKCGSCLSRCSGAFSRRALPTVCLCCRCFGDGHDVADLEVATVGIHRPGAWLRPRLSLASRSRAGTSASVMPLSIYTSKHSYFYLLTRCVPEYSSFEPLVSSKATVQNNQQSRCTHATQTLQLAARKRTLSPLYFQLGYLYHV